jgi:hypothetical protein
MVVNFRARGISRGTRKLTRTSTLIKKNSIVPLLGSRTLVKELAQDVDFKITVSHGTWFHKGQVLKALR